MPAKTPPAKLALIRSYGAEVVQEGERYAAAFELCRAYAETSGALLIHAYDSPQTIAGQGTLALELEEQAPDLDTVLVAVGGGGLIAGVAAWYSSGLRIVSVEPETCPTLERALAAGSPSMSPLPELPPIRSAPAASARCRFLSPKPMSITAFS